MATREMVGLNITCHRCEAQHKGGFIIGETEAYSLCAPCLTEYCQYKERFEPGIRRRELTVYSWLSEVATIIVEMEL